MEKCRSPCAAVRQVATGRGRTRRPMAIGHWPLARLSAGQHFSNYIRVRATLQRQLHAGGSRNVGVCPGPAPPPFPLKLQAAWYPWHPLHPRQCHVKRQRAQPNVGLADGQTDAYNSDGRQSTVTLKLKLTLPLTLTLTSALSLTGVTRPPPYVPPWSPAMAFLQLLSMRIAHTLPKRLDSCIPHHRILFRFHLLKHYYC